MSEQGGTIQSMEGYVYVVGFGSGVVKVGYTGSPQRRLAGYRKDGTVLGNPVVDVWVSPPHASPKANEERLIAFCLSQGMLASEGQRGEYFTGVGFDVVREFADTLDFARWTPEMEKEHQRRLEGGLDVWRNFFASSRKECRELLLPPLTTELESGTSAESSALAEQWATALGVSAEEYEAILPEFADRLAKFMLEAANLKRDAEYLAEAAERTQEAFEAHTTTVFAQLSVEAREAAQRKASGS